MPKKKAAEKEKATAEKLPVQFRVGSALLRRIDRAVANAGQSRNAWMCEAVGRYLESGKPMRLAITAEAMLADKTTLMIRLDADQVTEIDATCEEREYARTIWLLDACLSHLRAGERRRQ
jgi:hypothetical protein